MNKIYIYTDGACTGNPGPGGYGIVMELENSTYKKELNQGYRLTTNNRMELLAVIVGLEQIKIQNSKVVVVSDSKYVVDAVNLKWIYGWVKKRYKNVKNPDLWKRFLVLYNQHEVTMQWIKGHNMHPQNERCDFLAVQATKKPNLLIDTMYEESIKKEEKLF
ncbi:MAG: ribonuclease HI [Flavobacterium sp.]